MPQKGELKTRNCFYCQILIFFGTSRRPWGTSSATSPCRVENKRSLATARAAAQCLWHEVQAELPWAPHLPGVLAQTHTPTAPGSRDAGAHLWREITKVTSVTPRRSWWQTRWAHDLHGAWMWPSAQARAPRHPAASCPLTGSHSAPALWQVLVYAEVC